MTYPHSAIVIGTCSLCGGRVTLPFVWHSVVPPVPTCESCGAVKAEGPVIEMRRVTTRITNGTGGEQ